MIQLRILRCRGYSRLPGWALNASQEQRVNEDINVAMQTEIVVIQPHPKDASNTGHFKRQEMDCPLETEEEAHSC